MRTDSDLPPRSDLLGSDGRILTAAALVGLALVLAATAFAQDSGPPPVAVYAGGITVQGSDPADRGAAPACEPHDIALGTSSGDPYGFYSFSRDPDLALMREGCRIAPAGN